MVARLEPSAQRIDCRHPTGENTRCNSALQSGEVFCRARARRVRHACILVAFVLAEFFLEVRRRRIDRHADGTGQGVGFLSDMNGARGESWLSLLGHGLVASS